jgi:cytochrome c5
MTFRLTSAATAALAFGFATACTPAPTPAAAPAAETTTAPAAVADTGPLPLPLPINAVMVAMVDFAADGIWRPAASETPLTDKQWLLAEQDAVNLVASTTLITTAGTGVNDAEWVTEPDWRRWAKEMQATALEAKAAVDQKDQARLQLVGDRLVEICQTCHQKYKPGLPSMGITRFPIYPKRDGSLTPP